MFFKIHNYNIRSMQTPRCASECVCVCVSGNYAYRITGISIDTGIITFISHVFYVFKRLCVGDYYG